MDSRTTVSPFCPAGQDVSEPGRGAVVVAGGGVVGVEGAPGVPAGTVGRATVAVGGAVVGECGAPPWVATIVELPLPASARTMAAVAPATAMSRKSSTGQIQSPGYQPSRCCQTAASRPKTPPPGCSLCPHSRQYSWSGPCGAPQRGHGWLCGGAPRVVLVSRGPAAACAALAQRVVAKLRAAEHLQQEPAEVAQALLTDTKQCTPLLAELARMREGAARGAGGAGARDRPLVLAAEACEQRRPRHANQCNSEVRCPKAGAARRLSGRTRPRRERRG